MISLPGILRLEDMGEGGTKVWERLRELRLGLLYMLPLGTVPFRKAKSTGQRSRLVSDL